MRNALAVIVAKILLTPDRAAGAESGAGVGKTDVPAWGQEATAATDVIQVDGVPGYTTYQLRPVPVRASLLSILRSSLP
jgi:hypothetical protein